MGCFETTIFFQGVQHTHEHREAALENIILQHSSFYGRALIKKILQNKEI